MRQRAKLAAGVGVVMTRLLRSKKSRKYIAIGAAAVAGAGAIAGVAALGAGAVAVVAVSTLRSRRSDRLSGKVVLITGSSRGLGLALAEEFGRRGAKLVLCARKPDELDRARSLLLQKGATRAEDILTVPADLRRFEDAEAVIKKATEAFGQVDVLVNNAGVITAGPVEYQTVANFHEVMEANFFTSVHCSLAVMPQMLSRKDGSIVNIASIGGKVAVPRLLPYTASKFAMVGFSQGLHAELRPRGIHVLTVCPGLMRTGSHLHAQFSGDASSEYRWFSFLANMPVVSASARSAARKIVAAVGSRQAEIAITPQAALAARLSQIFPEVTLQASSIAHRVLPKPSHEATDEVQEGMKVRERESFAASSVGWKAAERYNQLG
jgi:short-subunit dehydrogenase